MKPINTILIFLILFSSCKDSKQNRLTEIKPTAETENTSFFPVTDFLKGQISEIKKEGINPLKITRNKNKFDSIWLQMEDLDSEFGIFLSPEIDTANLAGLFMEKKFLDQTIDAFTFTYDPIKELPDSFLLQRWDVYIDPESNTVKRIYMIKKSPDNKTLQLTWQTNKSCRIVRIANDLKGNDYVEREVTIKWDF